MNKLIFSILAGGLACAAGVVATEQDPGGSNRRLTGRNSPLRVAVPNAADLELRTTPVVRAVQTAADSVVSIYILSSQGRRRRGQEETEGQGSGVILDEAGLVITNWHVVATAISGAGYRVEARLKDGRRYNAAIMSSSADADLALLQLALNEGDTVKPAVIGDSDSLMVGETVIAIGNPQGHANTVTQGVLSATGRNITVRTPTGRRTYRGLLQTDAAINEGNSGGALLDITGKLIGINNAMAYDSENIGFAIPVDRVREVFENDLYSSKNLIAAWTSAWLGVQVANRDDRVLVTEVQPLSPARRAGVQVGDRLLQVGRVPIQNTLDYTRRLLVARVGEAFPLQVERGGRVVSLRPIAESYSRGQILGMAGMTLDEVTWEQDEDLVRKATLAFYEGSGLLRVRPLPLVLRVRQIEQGGPADDLGLQQGDILLALLTTSRYGPQEVRLDSAGDLARNLQRYRGREVHVWVLQDGEVKEGDLPVRG